MSNQSNVWKCSSCGAVLGYLDGTDILRIKYKDLYFYVNVIRGASLIKCLCRKCGKVNEVMAKAMKMSEPAVIELEKYL